MILYMALSEGRSLQATVRRSKVSSLGEDGKALWAGISWGKAPRYGWMKKNIKALTQNANF